MSGRGPERSGPVAAADPDTPSPLDILVVNWQDRENPRAGGAEAHLHEVFGRFARWGHRVTLLCSGFESAPTRTKLDGIEVHRVGGRYSFATMAGRYFKDHLARRAFDVIVEDLNKVPLFTPRWTARPVVLLVHHLFGATAFQEASLPLAAATWLLERPVPRAFRGATVIAVSQSTRADLVARGLDAPRIEVVPNGVDLGIYTPDENVARSPEPTALYVGRLKRYKRVDLPIRAIAQLRERGLPGRLVVAGRGDRRLALMRLAASLRLGEDRVRFLGFVSQAEKIALFREAWVHVLTSSKEGWGIAALEAAACGTATVASDVPGLRDSVVHGRTGWLVPHGDISALANRLAGLFADPIQRDRLGASGRSFAEGFSWEASARGVLGALQRVVARTRSGVESNPAGARLPPDGGSGASWDPSAEERH
ncbi:MAG: glycosyltransferase family 4 protein [Gemmatimonadota bacterium]|nr:glycosyltransferase family 4 protein [Gemmatimonadota bacterium]